MESSLVQGFIEDIVKGVYPDETLVRERYILAQALQLLVFLARRRPGKGQDRSLEMMRAAIKRMMLEQPGAGN